MVQDAVVAVIRNENNGGFGAGMGGGRCSGDEDVGRDGGGPCGESEARMLGGVVLV